MLSIEKTRNPVSNVSNKLLGYTIFLRIITISRMKESHCCSLVVRPENSLVPVIDAVFRVLNAVSNIYSSVVDSRILQVEDIQDVLRLYVSSDRIGFEFTGALGAI